MIASLNRHVFGFMSIAMFFATTSLASQDFLPPQTDESRGAFWVGLVGFSTRLGVDFEGPDQMVFGVGLDVGNLGSSRLRMRPSFELGFTNGDNTYVANAEVLYRFMDDHERAIPYVGAGVGLAGQENCANLDGCPSVMFQFALGFELNLNASVNWFIEYHAEDAFSRNRIFVGLTTKRGT